MQLLKMMNWVLQSPVCSKVAFQNFRYGDGSKPQQLKGMREHKKGISKQRSHFSDAKPYRKPSGLVNISINCIKNLYRQWVRTVQLKSKYRKRIKELQ